jgi:hypothetical protein
MRATITDYVRGRQAVGMIPAHVDAEFTATALIAAADGIQIQWMSDRSIDMSAHVRAVWGALLT